MRRILFALALLATIGAGQHARAEACAHVLGIHYTVDAGATERIDAFARCAR